MPCGKAAGINRETPDSPHFVYEHDANGENNGFIRESLTLFMPLVPPDSPAQMRASYVSESPSRRTKPSPSWARSECTPPILHYLTWDEYKKGTLEAGKLADVIVLDRDPLTVPTQELLKMQIDATIVDGRVLYECPGAVH